jgi:hypothetical protein
MRLQCCDTPCWIVLAKTDLPLPALPMIAMAPAELSIRALTAGWSQIHRLEEPTGLAISSLRMFLSSNRRESRHSSGKLDGKKGELVEAEALHTFVF